MQFKKIFKPALLVTVLASCFATAAHAEEEVANEQTLAPVIVTASRVEQLQKDAIPTTLVISRQDIENKRMADLPSLLRTEAGVQFASTGGPGGTTSIFMRGANPNQTLIMIDGVPITDHADTGGSSTMTTFLSHIQMDQIDHIEVVKGNVSAIYGSGAMGGVINIFTKQGNGEPTANVYAEYGTHDTVKLGAGISGSTSYGTSYSAAVSRFKTNGMSAMDSSKSTTVNPDDDYDRNVSFSANISHKLNADHELGGRFFYNHAKYGFDSDSGRNDDANGRSKNLMASVYSKNRFTKDWLSTATVSYNTVDRDYSVHDSDSFEWWGVTYSSDYDSVYSSESARFQWDNKFALNEDWTLTGGIDFVREDVDVKNRSSGYATSVGEDRIKYSIYAGALGNIGAHHLQANARYDYVEDAGAKTTGYLGYSYDLTSKWKALASVSTAFVAPTLFQQYDNVFGYGNTGLKSESSTSYEAGIQYAEGKDLVRLTVFETHVRDQIASRYMGGRSQYFNIDRVKNTGVELTAQSDVYGWFDLKANMTWQNPKNQDTDERLIRRSKWFGTLSASKTLGKWYFGTDISYNSHRSDLAYDSMTYSNRSVDLSSYALVDLNARYDITKNIAIYGRIANLFDKQYETSYGYNQLGRAGFIGVNVKM